MRKQGMGKWFGTGWKIFKAGEHAHFGWVLLEAVLDIRGWLVTLGVWAVTFFGASLDMLRSPLNVWLVSLLAAACAAILYIAWCFFRLSYRTKGAQALPSVDKPTHLFADAIPDFRVADAPSAMKLFEGKERDKLFPLLEAERLTAWARPMYSGLPPGSGSAPLARLPGSTWATHVLFCLPSSGPGTINQTFIKTKGRLESKWYDIHLNRKQIAAIWPNEERNEPELFSVAIDVGARRVPDSTETPRTLALRKIVEEAGPEQMLAWAKPRDEDYALFGKLLSMAPSISSCATWRR
jgi:hypothetical protein